MTEHLKMINQLKFNRNQLILILRLLFMKISWWNKKNWMRERIREKKGERKIER